MSRVKTTTTTAAAAAVLASTCSIETIFSEEDNATISSMEQSGYNNYVRNDTNNNNNDNHKSNIAIFTDIGNLGLGSATSFGIAPSGSSSSSSSGTFFSETNQLRRPTLSNTTDATDTTATTIASSATNCNSLSIAKPFNDNEFSHLSLSRCSSSDDDEEEEEEEEDNDNDTSNTSNKNNRNDNYDHNHLQQIQELLYERDMARNEAETSKEVISCIMEAVQLLTTQMKQKHYQIHADNSPLQQQQQKQQQQQQQQQRKQQQQKQSKFPATLSEISFDLSDDEKEEEDEEKEEGKEDLNNNKIPATKYQSFKAKYYQDGHIRSKKTIPSLSSSPSSPSSTSSASSVATFMSKENKRFSDLLTLFSNHIDETNQHEYQHGHIHNLSQIRSNLIALGHSCQMVSENANLLHNEATKTLLIDLQNVNYKLNNLQQRYKKTEKVAMKLYKDNKKMSIELDKSRLERKVLIKEMKICLDEKEIRKEFEDHLLQAWNIHERMINRPKGNDKFASPSSSSLRTVDGTYGNRNHNRNTKSGLEEKGYKNNQDNDNIYKNRHYEETPSTPLSQIANITGDIESPFSPSVSVGFQEMINNCPTSDSSVCTTIPTRTISNNNDNDNNTSNNNSNSNSNISSRKPRSESSWHSFLVPVLQLTPTPSMDVGDNNVKKPTLRGQDLHAFINDDESKDEVDRHYDLIEMKKNEMEQEMNSRITFSKSKSSTSVTTTNTSTSASGSASASPPKPESNFKKMFFSSSNSSSSSFITTATSTSVKRNKEKATTSNPARLTSSSNSSHSNNTTAKLPKSLSPITSLSSENSLLSLSRKLPPPQKVIKRKKRQYRQYKLTE